MLEQRGSSRQFPGEELREIGAKLAEKVFGDETLSFFIRGGYPENAMLLLKNYPLELHVKFWTRLCGKEGVNFPNGENLGNFLTILINGARKSSLHENPTKDQLRALTRIHLEALGLPQFPLRIISSSEYLEDIHSSLEEIIQKSREERQKIRKNEWEEALKEAQKRVQIEAETAGRSEICAVACGIVGDVAKSLHELAWGKRNESLFLYGGFSPLKYTELCAEWIIVEDIMAEQGYKQNPYLPLIALSREGYEAIGLRELGELGHKKKFFVIYNTLNEN